MAHPKLSKTRALEKLQAQLAAIPSIRMLPSSSAEFKKWRRDTIVALGHIFGADGEHVREFEGIRYSLMMASTRTPKSAFHSAFLRGLDTATPMLQSFISEIEEYWPDSEPSAPPPAPSPLSPFVDSGRLAALRKASSVDFDVTRLVRLAEEIDAAYRAGLYHAVAALTRALIDHVPPIFGVNGFAQVASNYAGTKSFKDSMERLSTSARRIGDAHLHTQIRARETLPSALSANIGETSRRLENTVEGERGSFP